MAENVPTDGFQNLNAPANPPSPGQQQQGNQQFASVVPQQEGNGEPAQDQQPAQEPQQQEPQGNDLSAAIAQLTEALKGDQKEPAAPGPDEPIEPGNPADTVTDYNTVDVEGIDDPLLRSMAYAMQTGAPEGLDFDRVFRNAIDRGDPSLIDRAYLIEKCGADANNRIAIAEGIVSAVSQQAEKAAGAVYELAGGKEQWGACSAAFNKSAPSELRSVVVQMLDSGNEKQVQAASKLVVEYAKGQGIVPTQNKTLSTGASMPAGQAMSKAEFQEALRTIPQNARDADDQRAALFARRALGKQLGK